jgi:hypothetical protein
MHLGGEKESGAAVHRILNRSQILIVFGFSWEKVTLSLERNQS